MNRPLKHTTKQLRWIALGGALSYYTEVLPRLRALLDSRGTGPGNETSWPWSRLGGLTSVGLGGLTVLLFLYLLLLPKLSGRHLEYTQWKNSEQLRLVIPILTITICLGWTTLLLSLYSFTTLPFFSSLLASSGLYILSFGLIGLIPVFWS